MNDVVSFERPDVEQLRSDNVAYKLPEERPAVTRRRRGCWAAACCSRW
jgi:hypothetical protein